MVRSLLDVARRAGEIATDLGLEQILDLVIAIAIARIPGATATTRRA